MGWLLWWVGGSGLVSVVGEWGVCLFSIVG